MSDHTSVRLEGPTRQPRMRPRVLIAVAVALPILVGVTLSAGAAGGRHGGRLATDRLPIEEMNKASSYINYELATNRGSNSRDGWYPNEPGLSPQLVGSSQFGQLFATKLNGQIYAQPLLVGGVLFVATETDWIYGLNPATGAILWSRHINTAFRDASLQCGDLLPSLGVTSTPTVDPATGIVYLVDQAYVEGRIGWFMHAINPATGAEVPHFPVSINGLVSNNHLQLFRSTKELQRAGLLFLNGVIYAAFGSHCDIGPYSGIIVGVSTTGRRTTMWSDEGLGTDSGGGIWQAGGGLVSDGKNQILFASSNGFGIASHPNGSVPSSSPPPNLADSVVRLVVQSNGSLRATNFFSMSNDSVVDAHDWDLAGSPVALPSLFSTSKYPHLLVATGKQGIVYLLNRDNLGGVGEGVGGTDDTLGVYGPIGDTMSTAGAWPGGGGYLYVATVDGGHGKAGHLYAFKFTTSSGLPSLHVVGIGSQHTVFGVSGPLVTSVGTKSGSAVVWIVNGSSLQAYDPVPVNGTLRPLGIWAIGNTDPFNPPGIGDGVVYVGNQEGVVRGFGKLPPSERSP